MGRYSSKFIILIAVSSFLLALRPAHADFGAGTITFDESTYQLYHNDSGDFVNYTTANGASNVAGTGYSGIDYSTGVFTVSDDAAIPYNAWFKAGTDVYVRFAFDKNNSGTIDSSDIPAVIEATYTAGTSLNNGNIIKGSMSSFNDPAADIFAYTSGTGSTEKSDFVASGYEVQAGNYFVRARKDANDNGVELNDDTETWTRFIIQYATTNGETVDSATGEIWDIDGTNSGAEQFTVTATLADSSTTSSTSPLGNTFDLDAKPWAWSFSGTSSSITQIEFTRKSGTESGTTYKSFFPLAFNNFNPVSSVGYTGAVPEPSTLAVFAVGSFGVVAGGIRRRRKQKA